MQGYHVDRGPRQTECVKEHLVYHQMERWELPVRTTIHKHVVCIKNFPEFVYSMNLQAILLDFTNANAKGYQ